MDNLTIFNNSFNDILSNPVNNIDYDNFYNNGIELLLKYTENIDIRENVLNKMIFVFPDKYELYYYMGYIYKDVDKSKALLWFKLCYEKNPTYIENFLDFSRILFDNQFFNYIVFLNKDNFLELSDDNRAQILCANLQLQSGKLLLAKKKFLDILKKNDTDHHKLCTIYLNLASIYNKFNDFHNCLSYLKKSYECAYTNNLSFSFKKAIITDIFLGIDYIYYQKSDFNIFHKSLLSDGHINEIYGEFNSYDFTNRSNNRLKIGYISSDFFLHAVSNFILPIIENHSYKKMDIYLFSNSKNRDNSFLEKVPACHYINIFLKEAKDVADIIYNNDIDILIDLNGHTPYNSLEVLTFNPAPIQMTYIGFPNSTHIPSIKYRITDKIADNCDSLQKYSEKRIYLPKCFLLFDSVIQKEPVNYRECAPEDFIILGSLNRENKNSPECLNVWRKILKENKRTKILIKINGNDTVEERTAYYLDKLELNDDASRLIIVDKLSDEDYIQLFYKIDILLDTFPYSGTTTSCNALYNSVPVISLYHKDYHAHNVTSSLLINSGLAELVAYNEEEYIQKVIQLSTSLEILNEYKRNIHTLFMKLMDKKEFMKSYEDLLINILY
jgi:predicted O-linked N-acetylglucosamine transferase (SPINDLY family)